ncbi:DNA repair protein RecN [Thermoleophilum album]|uniref:DNA repair protein RecN n=1 Tax=Thermoleophilum album TaxID=29539 RepID=A0A1H6FV64_THEAL|nr:DNA repair protein RecN [Thermoleophilum album]SEH14170.1 DNA repair protein RecN (Recombination protein N) [Thermoleophilum album]
MLTELRIDKLLLIDRAELRLAPGLNVITGETGAGKTLLVHALELLLGARPRKGCVRPGSEEAWVEAVFETSPDLFAGEGLGLERARALAAADEELIVARRVGADGRSRAYVGGRAVSLADLRAVTERLLGFVGQHEHRRLLSPGFQLDLLDRFAGDRQQELRDCAAAAHQELVAARRRLDQLEQAAAGREREIDLLRFELAEIDALAPSVAEELELRSERERLRRAEELARAAFLCAEALAGEGTEVSAFGDVLAVAEREAAAVRCADPDFDRLLARLESLRLEAQDLAAELRSYGERSESDPERLAAVEERLERYDRLLRKHGGTVGAVLEHAAACRERLAQLEAVEDAIAEARERVEALAHGYDELATALHESRVSAAPRLARAVERELRALAFPHARFEVRVEQAAVAGPLGRDAVAFALAANPGVDPAPIREAASGGELSRVLLALTAVAGAGELPTIVFDEIDAGVGGRTAHVVGERLASVAESTQVLCVTHLPQVAARADAHFRVVKELAAGSATTRVERLANDAVVAELCRMLGADESDAGARRHVETLRRAA